MAPPEPAGAASPPATRPSGEPNGVRMGVGGCDGGLESDGSIPDSFATKDEGGPALGGHRLRQVAYRGRGLRKVGGEAGGRPLVNGAKARGVRWVWRAWCVYGVPRREVDCSM